MVTRRKLDRVPEALRSALSRAPGWLRPPPGSARSPSRRGRVEPIVVLRRDVDRVQPSALRSGRDLQSRSRRHRPSEGDWGARRSGATSGLDGTIELDAHPPAPNPSPAGRAEVRKELATESFEWALEDSNLWPLPRQGSALPLS